MLNKIKKLVTIYQQIEAPVKASFWFIICNILQKGIAFITIPIFVRLMTTEEYGIFSIYQSWADVITIFATLKLSAGVFNNGMVKFKDDRDGYTSSMQFLSTILSLCMIILFFIFQKQLVVWIGLPIVVIIVMLVEILLAPAYYFWATRQRFEYQYKTLVLFTIGVSLLSPVIGIVIVKSAAQKGIARVLSFALINIACYLFFYIRNYWKGKKFFVEEYWIFALKFNIPLIPHYLSMSILSQSDRIMIDFYCGTAKAGIYSLAYSVAMLMLIVTNAINSSLIPYTYQAFHEHKEDKLADIFDKVLIFLAGLVLLIVAVAPELISILGTEDYSEAIWIVPPVAGSVYLILLYGLFANIEFYYEKTKYVMIASSAGALCNFILNLIFIPRLGYLAAGYTTLAAYGILAVIHYFFMKRILIKKNIGRQVFHMKNILFITASLITCTIIFMLFYQLFWIRCFLLLIIMLFTIRIGRNAWRSLKKKDREGLGD